MISSLTNPKIKHIVQLSKSAKDRRKEGVFIVEGPRMCLEADPEMITETYVTSEYLKRGGDLPAHDSKKRETSGINETSKDAGASPLPYEEVTEEVMRKMSDTQTPQGILCVVRRSTLSVEEFLSEHADGKLRILILEGIQDPGNLGTMARTAEAAGFDAIIADENTVDIYNPKTIRSTMGAIFRLPILYVGDLTEYIPLVRKNGVKLYAAHLKGSSVYRDVVYGDRVGILIGNEGNGLSDKITDMADELVKIPMHGKAESLNAAVAAALLMYEVDH